MATDVNLATLQTILSRYPDLQDFGFGAFDSQRKSASQIASEVKAGRARMLEARSLDEFAAARKWLSQFPKVQKVNLKGTSYGLKHLAEDVAGYCTNGMFIAAAVAEGFKIERVRHDSPNAWINISSKAWAKGPRSY